MVDVLSPMVAQGVVKSKARSIHMMVDREPGDNKYLGMGDDERSGAFVGGKNEHDD